MKNEELLKWLNGLDPCICCNELAKKMISLDELDLLYETKNYIENIFVHSDVVALKDKNRINYISSLLRELADNNLDKEGLKNRFDEIKNIISK